MSAFVRSTTSVVARCALVSACLLALPLAASAQEIPASKPDPHAHHHGMQHAPAASKDDKASPKADPASMPDMQHAKPASGSHDMHHGHSMAPASPAAHDDHANHDMEMGSMQGGKAPPDARNPDYSDGIGYGDMSGMDMLDNAPFGMLMINQLEAFHGRDSNGQNWEIEGRYGNDVDKLWLRSEGERSGGRVGHASVEALWNRSLSTFWNTQIGVRHDNGHGPDRSWAAFGIQGLAPYWFELEATVYAGASGRTAVRLRAEYELLLTQRLVLQPELEVNLYGKNDPATRTGSGLSDAQLGVRLRYEIRREFAPYIGVNWGRRFGTSADYARADHHSVFDQQIVAGFRIWF